MKYFVFTWFIVSPFLAFPQLADSSIYNMAREAIEMVDNGLYNQGLKLLKKARNKRPREYDFSLEIGRTFLLAGKPLKAERYLYDLQFHRNVQPDLFLLLQACYEKLNNQRKLPDYNHKKEVSILNQGIQILPKQGMLYEALGKLKLELQQPEQALAVWEKGIKNAPNYAENYFWAAKILSLLEEHFWAWIYAEYFFNMSNDSEFKNVASDLILKHSEAIFSNLVGLNLEQLDWSEIVCDFQYSENKLSYHVAFRSCLIKQLREKKKSSLLPLIDHFREMESLGYLEAYIAHFFRKIGSEQFYTWGKNNQELYLSYLEWSVWNKLMVLKPIRN